MNTHYNLADDNHHSYRRARGIVCSLCTISIFVHENCLSFVKSTFVIVVSLLKMSKESRGESE